VRGLRPRRSAVEGVCEGSIAERERGTRGSATTRCSPAMATPHISEMSDDERTRCLIAVERCAALVPAAPDHRLSRPLTWVESVRSAATWPFCTTVEKGMSPSSLVALFVSIPYHGRLASSHPARSCDDPDCEFKKGDTVIYPQHVRASCGHQEGRCVWGDQDTSLTVARSSAR